MNLYSFLADLIVVVHFAYVAFVVLGMAAILLGVVLRWSWVRNFWFRTVHLAMIAVVVVESLCGIICPLTHWENQLRGATDDVDAARSFIGRWAHDLLFIDVPPSVMPVVYVIFGAAVLATFVFAPPRWPSRKAKTEH
jgi:hypothetical protein